MNSHPNSLAHPRHVQPWEVDGAIVELLAVAKAFDSTSGPVIECVWRRYNTRLATALLEFQALYVARAALVVPPQIALALDTAGEWGKSGGLICRAVAGEVSLALAPM